MKLKSAYSWGTEKSLPASSYIQGYLGDSEHGKGRIETLETELDNCREMISFLAAALLEKGILDLQALNMVDTEIDE